MGKVNDMTKDEMNREFEGIVGDLDDEGMALNALNDVLDEMIDEAHMSDDVVALPYRDGTVEVNEREAYKMAASMAARFGWGGNILLTHDVRLRIEALTDTPMPIWVVEAIHTLLQSSEFFDGAGLAVLVEMQEAFICNELGLVNEDALELIVNAMVAKMMRLAKASKLGDLSPFSKGKEELVERVAEELGVDVGEYDLNDRADLRRLILVLADKAGWSDDQVAEIERRLDEDMGGES